VSAIIALRKKLLPPQNCWRKIHIMRKTSFIVYAVLIAVITFMCSYRQGAATHGWDCTGGETGLSNQAGCSSGGGCHSNSATPGIVVMLQLDSAGIPVTTYKAGLTYTVTIKGVNTTSSILPKYGFQVAAFKGASAQVTPVNEGTFQQTGLPANVHYQAPVNLTYTVANIVEQGLPLSPDSGTGGTGTIYKQSFTWTAPATGTGTVSFWAALNAVNNNGTNDNGDLWNIQTLVVAEDTAATVNAIEQISANPEVTVYPNPVADVVHLEVNNANPGPYNLEVFDSEGRKLTGQMIDVTGIFSATTLSTINWSSGIYFVKLSRDGTKKVVKIIKR
jgi:hypothetical protein